MRYRTLGRTGLRISEVGFGGGGIGGVWGKTTEAESVRAVHRALEAGVTFFDVAPGYGNGKAEEVVGQGLKGRRSEVSITTKVSLPPAKVDDKRNYILQSVEGSLRRLQTDHVELLLVHNPISSRHGVPYQGCITGDDALEMAEVYGELQRAGKVRFIGFTGWRCNRQELAKLINSGKFDALQTEYNILNQSAQEAPPPGVEMVDIQKKESEGAGLPLVDLRYSLVDQCQTIPQATAKGMGIVCIRPVLAGVLSDAIDRPLEPYPDMEKMLQRARSLEFLKRDGRRTLSQAAFIFSLMNPGISTIVPGVKNAAEIEEAAGCSGARPLTKAESRRIDELYRNNFGVS